MDFRKKTSRRSVIKPEFTLLSKEYPHFMQLYRDFPKQEISFQEFEECASERLSLLQILDEVGLKGLKGEEWIKAIVSEMRKYPQLRQFSKLITCTRCHDEETDYLVRRRDHISHFVLRMAYCSSEDKRRWFIARELDLFKFRWFHLSEDDRSTFLRNNHLNYLLVDSGEKSKLELLSEGMISLNSEYYKVHFTLASDLIRARKVYLRKGYAFVTSENIINIILTSYRSQLSQSLSYASRRLYKICDDERIVSVLKGAANNVREVDYVIEDKDKINIASLDDLCSSSFPPCMQSLHRTLRQEHHLKFFGRQQYGLFLKGIGVSLEDALRFWRSEFTKKMDPDKFEKSYSYNIRHNYGKEGKRANYTPHSCLRIINGSVNPGDSHGCPFRHRDAALIKRTLTVEGFSSAGIQEVIDAMRKGQYQVACSKYFQLKHKVEFAVNHPNAYFDESQRILRGKAASNTTSTPDNRKGSKIDPRGRSTTTPKAVENKNDSVWHNSDDDIDFSTIET